MRPKGSLGGAIDSHQGERDRILDAQSKYFKITGEVDVTTISASGEVMVNVNFPIHFLNKPKLSFGLELFPGQPLTAGSLPSGSVVVTSWSEAGREDGSNIFTGAVLAIVVNGYPGQTVTVQWHVEGEGLRGPVSDHE